jgi:hypothetical protein
LESLFEQVLCCGCECCPVRRGAALGALWRSVACRHVGLFASSGALVQDWVRGRRLHCCLEPQGVIKYYSPGGSCLNYPSLQPPARHVRRTELISPNFPPPESAYHSDHPHHPCAAAPAPTLSARVRESARAQQPQLRIARLLSGPEGRGPHTRRSWSEQGQLCSSCDHRLSGPEDLMSACLALGWSVTGQ